MVYFRRVIFIMFVSYFCCLLQGAVKLLPMEKNLFFSETTKLHEAVKKSDINLVKSLIPKMRGWEILKKDEEGRTALQLALALKNKEIAKVIVEGIPRLKVKKNDPMKSTIFHKAIFWRETDVINYFLLYGEKDDFEKKDVFGKTPLHAALFYERKFLVDILLERVSELKKNRIFPWNETKLHLAVLGHRLDAVHYYLANESDEFINRKDFNSKTALKYALEIGNRKMVDLFMERVPEDMRVTRFKPCKRQQIHLAAERGRAGVAEYFLRFNSGNESKYMTINKAGYNPLHTAAKKGHCDVVRVILKYFVKEENEEKFINKKTVQGEKTPLHLAVKRNHFECVKVLIEEGADTFAKNGKGLTPWKEFKKKGKKGLTKEQHKIRKLLKETRKYNIG